MQRRLQAEAEQSVVAQDPDEETKLSFGASERHNHH